MDIYDVVTTEVQTQQLLEVPKNTLWNRGEGVPGQNQCFKRAREALQVELLDVGNVVV